MGRRHAVVLGASMSGLLAARVLSDLFDGVTVVERDDVRSAGGCRRGVPQARHTHGLLARGRETLEELFPGLTDELVAQGAVLGDLQGDVRWYNDGHLLRQVRSGMQGVLLSRPMLELAVRARVLALPRVALLAPAELVDLEHDAGRVIAVRARRRNADSDDRLPADLVVDATGRGSCTPAWLEEHGYPRPKEEKVEVGLAYSTLAFRWTPGDLDGDAAVVITPTLASPRFGVALRQEDERWTVTVGGYNGDAAPIDLPGFRAFAATLPSGDVARLIADKQPLDEARRYTFRSSQRRRYERLRRFPEGLLVIGDAVCSFNPAYGQGMTVAAVEALALRDTLAAGDADLARRYFPRAARVVQGPWDIVVGGDLRLPVVPGPRPLKVRAVNAYVAQVQAAAAVDPVVGRALLDVANLLEPPESLMRPATVRRMLRARRTSVETVPRPRRPPVPGDANVPAPLGVEAGGDESVHVDHSACEGPASQDVTA